MKKTKCVKCGKRLYHKKKGVKLICLDCYMKEMGLDDICTTGAVELKSYYELDEEGK